jgi:hypothetical protein
MVFQRMAPLMPRYARLTNSPRYTPNPPMGSGCMNFHTAAPMMIRKVSSMSCPTPRLEKLSRRLWPKE